MLKPIRSFSSLFNPLLSFFLFSTHPYSSLFSQPPRILFFTILLLKPIRSFSSLFNPCFNYFLFSTHPYSSLFFLNHLFSFSSQPSPILLYSSPPSPILLFSSPPSPILVFSSQPTPPFPSLLISLSFSFLPNLNLNPHLTNLCKHISVIRFT